MSAISGNEKKESIKAGKRKRTESIDVKFANELAAGWAFDVGKIHREALDIIYDRRVDKEKSTKQKSVYKRVWTRGVPPIFSFPEGSIFYDPPGIRRMKWGDALKIIRRSVMVLNANADQEPSQGAGRVDGKVTFVVREYRNGEICSEDALTTSQIEFEYFLRTGSFAE